MTHDAEILHPLVSLRDVSVRFGRHVGLAGVTLDVPQGGVTAIVGPNGAGKTTLLRLLGGALRPSTGHVAWRGPVGRPRIALVAQAVALYPFLTVGENCLAAGRMEGGRGAALAARAEAALGRTLCADVRDRLVGRLSGGYQRRAAIAAALMGDADLLLLDEPTTGLDTEARDAIAAILRGLAAAGTTIVLATHDFALADATANLVGVLQAGSLRTAGEPRQLCQVLFPARVHVEVTLADEPLAAATDVLAALGAQPLAARRYALFSAVDGAGLPAALPRLHGAGIAVRETRISEPGVAALVERLCRDRATP